MLYSCPVLQNRSNLLPPLKRQQLTKTIMLIIRAGQPQPDFKLTLGLYDFLLVSKKSESRGKWLDSGG
jgi:hypothetical protein